RDEIAAHARAGAGGHVLRAVFDGHRDPVADRETGFADGAGGVLATHVEPLAELARAHGDDDVPARAVEGDDDSARRALPPFLDERELLEVQHGRYDIRVGVKAAFFDVGDTLVEGWDPDYRSKARAALAAHYGE